MQKRHWIEHRSISAGNRKVPLRHPAFLAGGESAHFGSLFEPVAIRSTVLSVSSARICRKRMIVVWDITWECCGRDSKEK